VIETKTAICTKLCIDSGSGSENSQTNSWDNVTEGNYWSDYLTKYPNAKEIADTGIWYTTYIIDENNKDNYPLMGDLTPISTPTPTPTLTPSPTSSIIPTSTPSETPTISPEPQTARSFPVDLIYFAFILIAVFLAVLAYRKMRKND
jgi:hypothetical protein